MSCRRLCFAEVFESFQMLQMLLLLPRCETLLCVGEGERCPRSGAPSEVWLTGAARLTARRMGGQNRGSK